MPTRKAEAEWNSNLAEGGGRLKVEVAALPLSELVHRNLQVIGTVMKSRTTEEKSRMVQRFSDRWLPEIESGGIPVDGGTGL